MIVVYNMSLYDGRINCVINKDSMIVVYTPTTTVHSYKIHYKPGFKSHRI